MIGCSLSFCVIDIAKGRIPYEDVEKIITATGAKTFDDYIDVVDEYSKIYWNDCEYLARNFAIDLWLEGKIIQPRLKNEPIPYIGEMGKHWVEKESDIIWL